ncbi:MAG: GTP 3',8-cyclase MoaA [Lachnospiraceae bacterium]|nr:GTP 3',8-cyclase MoaA [Lachnospiraceae bacterium]
MEDFYGRNIDYMRVSITDRCNLRCRYCMPEDIQLNQMSEILTFEEIEEICQAAADIGIKKLKVTGGEPLVRLGCPELIGKLKKIPGIEQVTLTTNGILLKQYLPELVENGVDAINVSLDSLDREQYASLSGKDRLEDVLEGIHAAAACNIPLKINSVLIPGYNDGSWEQLVELAAGNPLDVRFIEMMPIGYGKKYTAVDNGTLLSQLQAKYPDMQSDSKKHGNGPAVYYRIPGFQGSIGFISAVHGRFCGSCNRIRLTSQGKCKPCLCYDESVDLRQLLRGGQEETGPETRRILLQEGLKKAVSMKPAQHCFEALSRITEVKQMVQIGG